VEIIGGVANCLQLPVKSNIHDVFHVAMLKKFAGMPLDHVVSLSTIQHGRVILVPDKVICARLNRGQWEE
jgi:hypothetical protein